MNQIEMKNRLVRAFKDWIAAQGITQAKAADLLGLTASQVSEIMRGQSRYTVGWLLDLWVTSGGKAQLILESPQANSSPPDSRGTFIP